MRIKEIGTTERSYPSIPKKQTIHVKFLDGDVDTALPWKDVVIPDQEEEVKG